LAEKVVEITGSGSKIVYKQLPQDDPKVREPDISKAVEELNWTPEVDLETGLRRTMDNFKRRLKLA